MAAINTTQTAFAGNDQITSSKLNNILLQSKIDAGAVTGDNTISVVSGQIQVGTLKAANYPALAITAGAIADATITPVKLSAGGPSWDASSSTTGSAVTGTYTVNLTPARTGDGDTTFNIGSQTATSTNASISRKSGANGAFDFVQTGTGEMTFTSGAGAMTFTSATAGFKFGTAPMPTPSGVAPIFGVRAWVNFNGSTSDNLAFNYTRDLTIVTVSATSHKLIVGNVVYLDFTTGGAADGRYTVTEVVDVNSFKITTVLSGTISSGTGSILRRAIRASGNVSSVTNLNTSGDYFVNFAIPMPDANYATSGFANYPSGTAAVGLVSATSGQSVSQQGCDITVANSGTGDGVSTVNVSVMFIR